jgi:LemA protein
MKRYAFTLALVVTITGSGTGCGYNTIQSLDEKVEQQKGNVNTELQRRSDLIPNLVATVDQAAKMEQQTQTRIAEARSGLTAAREQLAGALQKGAAATTTELSAANDAVSGQLRNFINVSVEAYPDLKSNAGFIKLQDELTETENRLSVARRDFNETVAQYNTYIRRFPQAITAKVIGAKRKDTFEAAAGAQTAPQVQFPTTSR